MNNLISRLSELRCQYNCFDENERDAYHTLSEAIKALSDVPDTNVGDTISRQAAIDALNVGAELLRRVLDEADMVGAERAKYEWGLGLIESSISDMKELPSVQQEQTYCEYCHEDFDGYVRPIEKNSHAWLVRRGRTMKLRVGFKGEYRECDILFCPMCGRRLNYE